MLKRHFRLALNWNKVCLILRWHLVPNDIGLLVHTWCKLCVLWRLLHLRKFWRDQFQRRISSFLVCYWIGTDSTILFLLLEHVDLRVHIQLYKMVLFKYLTVKIILLRLFYGADIAFWTLSFLVKMRRRNIFVWLLGLSYGADYWLHIVWVPRVDLFTLWALR